MEKKSGLHKAVSSYDHIEEYVLIGSLVFNVLLVMVQIIMRTVFRNSLTWSEELSRYIFIWQIWLGASIALKYKEHIKVTLLLGFIKAEKAKQGLCLIADLIWFLFSTYMIVNGMELLASMGQRNALSTGLGLPLVVVYAAFPIGSALVSLRLLGVLCIDIRQLAGKDGDVGQREKEAIQAAEREVQTEQVVDHAVINNKELKLPTSKMGFEP